MCWNESNLMYRILCLVHNVSDIFINKAIRLMILNAFTSVITYQQLQKKKVRAWVDNAATVYNISMETYFMTREKIKMLIEAV